MTAVVTLMSVTLSRHRPAVHPRAVLQAAGSLVVRGVGPPRRGRVAPVGLDPAGGMEADRVRWAAKRVVHAVHQRVNTVLRVVRGVVVPVVLEIIPLIPVVPLLL